MKLALVTIVTANLEQMRTFYQAVLQIEPQTYRDNYVEFPLESGTLALWRQSEYETFGMAPMRGALLRRQPHHVLAGLTPSAPEHGVPASPPTPGEG
jgi:catechol 2,3-dioxygenase-like lactoylglutathione lyase family enzyme